MLLCFQQGWCGKRKRRSHLQGLVLCGGLVVRWSMKLNIINHRLDRTNTNLDIYKLSRKSISHLSNRCASIPNVFLLECPVCL